MTADEYRARRERLGLTQAQLAEELGLSPNTVARRERDELPIPREAELAIFYLASITHRRTFKKETRL